MQVLCPTTSHKLQQKLSHSLLAYEYVPFNVIKVLKRCVCVCVCWGACPQIAKAIFTNTTVFYGENVHFVVNAWLYTVYIEQNEMKVSCSITFFSWNNGVTIQRDDVNLECMSAADLCVDGRRFCTASCRYSHTWVGIIIGLSQTLCKQIQNEAICSSWNKHRLYARPKITDPKRGYLCKPPNLGKAHSFACRRTSGKGDLEHCWVVLNYAANQGMAEKYIAKAGNTVCWWKGILMPFHQQNRVIY